MRLTSFTDFALRALMRLAGEPGRSFATNEIAAEFGISRNHLAKVVRDLAEGGFISTQRGAGGGFTLARPPEAITLGDVVRALEDRRALVECFDRERNACVISPACGLRGVLDEALRGFLAVLDRYSLADLVANPGSVRRMRRLLSDPLAIEARP